MKNIIFDLGNVVLTNDWHDGVPGKIEELSEYFGISESDMEKGWQAAWPDMKIGKITEDEFWNIFLREAGAQNIDVKHAKQLYRKYQKPIENMLELLKRLKKHCKLAALPNIGKEWLDFKREKYKLDDYFDVIVSSAYSGLAKPDPKVYDCEKSDTTAFKPYFLLEMLKDTLGFSPELQRASHLVIRKLKATSKDCIFIDDAKKNILPAKKMGMKTILFKGQKDLERKLSILGLKF